MKINFDYSWILCRLIWILLLPACAPAGGDDEEMPGREASYRTALHLLEEAIAAHGAIAGRGVILEGEGFYDISTRLQGTDPFQPERAPLREVLACDQKTGRVVYESNTRVNPDAPEWVRYDYDGEGRLLFLERVNGFAFWDAHLENRLHQQRYARILPQHLLGEAYAQRASLVSAGGDRLSFRCVTGEILQLHFGPGRMLRSVSFLLDMPLRGDTEVTWMFDDYREIENLGKLPRAYRVRLGDKVLKEVTFTQVSPFREDHSALAVPGEIVIPARPKTVESAPPPAGTPRVREITDGVFVLANARPGFHHLFVEFADHVVVIDAPAGWYEMQQLPPMNWAGDVTSNSVGRVLLDSVRATVPGKPVRYLVLTHHHSDHAGGYRPFVEAGAAILCSPTTARLLREVAGNEFTLDPEAPPASAVQPFRIETVEGDILLEDSTRALRLYDVGDNPHAEGMLVVYLPQEKILYQSDLFEPASPAFFPNKSRVEVMKWFVGWLDRSGLAVERVYAVHGGLRVTEEQLERMRDGS